MVYLFHDEMFMAKQVRLNNNYFTSLDFTQRAIHKHSDPVPPTPKTLPPTPVREAVTMHAYCSSIVFFITQLLTCSIFYGDNLIFVFVRRYDVLYFQYFLCKLSTLKSLNHPFSSDKYSV